MSYQAIPFSGEWNEDPENLLGWFLQCMGTADDERKARHFVYYLWAGSDAHEWFEDLLEEEKESWVTIEQLFRRKWLKEEISIKESVTSQNEPQRTSTLVPAISADSTTALATHIETTASHNPEMGHNIGVATSQSAALSENRKNAKIVTTKDQISQNFMVFSPQTPFSTFSNSPELSTTTTSLDTQSAMVDFTPKQLNVEISLIPTKITPKTLAPSISEPINKVIRVYTI